MDEILHIKQMSIEDISDQLMLIRAEKQTNETKEKELKDELLSRSDFNWIERNWIKIILSSRPTITLKDWINLELIKQRYPDLVEVKQILDPSKVSDALLHYIKEKILMQYMRILQLIKQCSISVLRIIQIRK